MTHPTTGQADGYLFDKGPTFLTFGLLCLLMIFDFADRMMLAALLPAIRADWQISDTMAGLLSSILTLGMVLFAFPAAILIDRWSRIRSASLMGILWSLASAAGALAQNVGQLLFSRALVGVGEAGYAPAAYTWISTVFPKRRRQFALGLFSSAQPIGMALGVAVGGYIATHYGWQHALGIVALPGLFVAFWLYRGRDFAQALAPAADSASAPAPAAGPRKRDILGIPSLLLSYLSGSLGTLQWVPLIYFLPTWFNREHAIPVQSASLMTSGIVLLTIVSIPLGGWLMDRWNLRDERAKLIWPALAGLVSTALYGAAFLLTREVQVSYALILVALFIASSAGTGPLALSQELVPSSIRAFSGTCSVVAIHLLGSVPGPLLAGFLSDRYGLTNALASIAVFSGIAYSAVLLAALRFYPADLRRAGLALGHSA